MKSKVIGFVGVDVQDTMLYLSRIFYHMGKKVLLADYSESRALYYSIPLIPGVNVYSVIVEYRDTYFTCGKITEEEMAQFDVILLFFGFTERPELQLCSHLIYTTDYEKNHMERIVKLQKSGKAYTQLVYRNVGKESRSSIYEMKLRECSPYYCNDNRKEKRLRRQCQYNDSYGFHGISASFRKYLQDTVKAVFPKEAEGREFAVSFRRAEMGV